jgi:Domain of unknown function (DUF5666)
MRRRLGLAAAAYLAFGLAHPAGAEGDTLRGQVTRKEGDTLVVHRMGSTEVHVHTDDRTRVHSDRGSLGIDEIQPGDQVHVTARGGSPEGTRTAREIRVEVWQDVSASGWDGPGTGRESGRTELPGQSPGTSRP